MFFTRIAELMKEDYNVNLVLKMKGGMMTVVFMPTFDSKVEPAKKLVPLTVTDRPEVLDQAFVSVISTAIAKTNDFAESLKIFEKGVDAAMKESKKGVEQKSKATETTRDERMGWKEPAKPVKEQKNAEPAKAFTMEELEDVEGGVDIDTGEITGEETGDSNDEPFESDEQPIETEEEEEW